MKISTTTLLVLIVLTGFASSMSATVHVPEKYSVVKAGERLYFEVSVKYPENKQRKDLKFDYSVFKDDSLIAKARSLKAIETQMSFIDYITLPKNAKTGLATLKVIISDFAQLRKEISTSFYISRNPESNIKIYFIIVTLVSLFVGMLVGMDIMIHKRKLQNKNKKR